MTVFVCFILHLAYTLFVLAFGLHSGHWRGTIQELACEPAATAPAQHFGNIPRLVFPSRASLLRHFDTLLYSHCPICPLSYIDEATTPLSIQICILIYPWLALGEQSEGCLISVVGFLSIFASSALEDQFTLAYMHAGHLYDAADIGFHFDQGRAGLAGLGTRRTSRPFSSIYKDFYCQEGYTKDRRKRNISAT